MTEAMALWHEGREESSLRKEDLTPLRDGWCEIRTLFSLISPGTETLVAGGRVPGEIHVQMTCPYMGGAFPFPVKYGYSLVGEVVAGSGDKMGQVVHLLHPHQSRCRVREEDVYTVPTSIPPERASLASNMETAVNAVWDSGVTLGDRVLVVGFGTVGSLVTRLVSGLPGVRVQVVDTDTNKVELAGKMGFEAAVPHHGGTGAGFDLAFHASGTGEGLQTAVDHVGFEGTVVDLSWYGSRKVSLALGGTFHTGRKKIVSSQVSHVSSGPSVPASLPSRSWQGGLAGKRSRWDRQRRKDLVFSCLNDPGYDNHLTRRVDFQDLPEVFTTLRHSPGRELSYLVTY